MTVTMCCWFTYTVYNLYLNPPSIVLTAQSTPMADVCLIIKFLLLLFCSIASVDPPFSLSAWTVAYPWSDGDSHFESSNDMLNRVYELCRNTLKVIILLDACITSRSIQLHSCISSRSIQLHSCISSRSISVALSSFYYVIFLVLACTYATTRVHHF